MFYRPEDGHGLRHNPFNALVVPRPIGWISTLDGAGRANLAPFSFFNAVAYQPPQVMFSAGPRPGGSADKDSAANAAATGEFVVNLATWTLREKMIESSIDAPPGVDEFDHAGLGKLPSQVVSPPRVAESPVHLECRHLRSLAMKADSGVAPNTVVFGEVVGVHIDERVIVDGVVDYAKLDALGRLGGYSYSRTAEAFRMKPPVWQDQPDS